MIRTFTVTRENEARQCYCSQLLNAGLDVPGNSADDVCALIYGLVYRIKATQIRIHVQDVGPARVLASQQASNPSGDAK